MGIPRSELVSHLQEQRRFLLRSARDFDEGDTAEAKRLATTLRVLLDDRGANAHPLLGMLVDLPVQSFPCVNERPPDSTAIMEAFVMYGFTGDALEPFTAMSGRWEPFSTWWREPCDHYAGFEITRESCVRAMANRGGGAHIDPREATDYRGFAETGALGWSKVQLGVPGSETVDDVLNNPLPAIVRATTAEVLHYLDHSGLI